MSLTSKDARDMFWATFELNITRGMDVQAAFVDAGAAMCEVFSVSSQKPSPEVSPETVEIRLAFTWDCPECGTEQLERATNIEDPERFKEIRESTGGGDGPGIAIAVTSRVACKDCGRVFKAETAMGG